jgi:hypothetical protein
MKNEDRSPRFSEKRRGSSAAVTVTLPHAAGRRATPAPDNMNAAYAYLNPKRPLC